MKSFWARNSFWDSSWDSNLRPGQKERAGWVGGWGGGGRRACARVEVFEAGYVKHSSTARKPQARGHVRPVELARNPVWPQGSGGKGEGGARVHKRSHHSQHTGTPAARWHAHDARQVHQHSACQQHAFHRVVVENERPGGLQVCTRTNTHTQGHSRHEARCRRRPPRQHQATNNTHMHGHFPAHGRARDSEQRTETTWTRTWSAVAAQGRPAASCMGAPTPHLLS
jgi:hypothetical protein